MLDSIDREILSILQIDSRTTQRELGRRVGLSPNAAGARVQRLVDRGVITGFGITVDHGALGRPMEASVDLWEAPGVRRVEELRRIFREDDRIVEALHLSGPLDFRIRVRVASPQDLNELLVMLKDDGGIAQSDSRIVLDRLSVAAEDAS